MEETSPTTTPTSNLIGFTLAYLLLSFSLNYAKKYLPIDLDLFLDSQNFNQMQIGLTIIRIFTGLTFIVHGYQKVTGGSSEWIWMGEQMKNFGINFTPAFLLFGLAAAMAEFGGGLALTFGWHTRFFSALLAITMLVAVIHHIQKGDPWGYISFPLGLMFVFIGLMVTGSGPWSIDHWLR